MDSLQKITGDFEAWWVVTILTMWFFSAYAIHTGFKNRRTKVFFYIVWVFSIVGFIKYYTFG
jgi:hypothetical protein